MKFYKLFILIIFLINNIYALDTEKCYESNLIQAFKNQHKNYFISMNRSFKIYTIKIDSIPVDIYIPELKSDHCYKLLLVLPGWKFSRKRWFNETELLKYLKQDSIIAIAPEMHTTVYESIYFKETKLRWHKKPGMIFIEEDLIPYFKQYHLLQENKYNFGLGLSTGARGVIMIASRNPALFFAIAALSGDFDQTITPNDNLMRLTYGEYKDFKDRWQTVDNPIYNIKQNGWQSHLYLGHGKEDTIVSIQHSNHFYEFLKNFNTKAKIKYNICDTCKHDFFYWNLELKSIFNFFNELISN